MKCPNCGSDINEKHTHCFKCGKGLNGEPDFVKSITTMSCSKCGSEIDSDYRSCTKCGYEIKQQCDEKQKYPALRTIATLYKVVAFLTLAVCIVAGFTMGGIGILISSVSGIIACITLLAAGEGIKVLIDIEQNTRMNK